MRRATRAARESIRLVVARREIVVVVVGLLSPRLITFAGLLCRFGVDVTFDACDSWRLLESTTPANSPLSRIARQGAEVQARTTSRLPISYISLRDANADSDLNARGNRRVEIVPPTAPSALRELPPLAGGEVVQRFSFSGDPGSFHVKEGVDLLRVAWPQHHRRYPASRLDVYGGRSHLLAAGEGSASHGFAVDIRDLYRGPTVVIIANRLSSGIPNKLVEAVTANRPIIIHASLWDLLDPHPWVQSFHDEKTLLEALARLQEIRLTRCPPIAWKSVKRRVVQDDD